MENFVFPDKCSFMLIAMTKSLNKSTVDQQTLQSLWGCLGDNHWAQSVLRSLSIDRQIKTYQSFHIWDSHLGPKASFMKGVEHGILNIANYSIVRRVGVALYTLLVRENAEKLSTWTIFMLFINHCN